MSDLAEFINNQRIYGSTNVDLTYRCPLKCSACARYGLYGNEESRKYIKGRFASSKDAELESIKKIYEFFDHIGYCGQISDPVYHPKIIEILRLKKEKYPEKEVIVHTAAHQKNIEWYRKAFEASDKHTYWIFGLDGLPDTSMIYREGQNSQLIMDAMILGREMGIFIKWQYIIFEYNEHQMEEAKKIADEHGIVLGFMASNRTNGKVKVPKRYLQTGDKVEIIV